MDEDALEESLSRPTAADIDAAGSLRGDLLILGIAGKMGPTLARLARRADEQAGISRRIIGVARFSGSGTRERLERQGIEAIAGDLTDRAFYDTLPTCPNVMYMVGQKFGTSGDQPLTWATNVYAAALSAERFAASRLVAFSTGNVYPLWPVERGGPSERDATGPVGEYAQSALARERILEFLSRRNRTPMTLLRLNYAVEPRYGVLRDVADKVFGGEPIDLSMGYVNVIWQRDANSVALRAFGHCEVPPFVLNVTGMETVPVRSLAEKFGEMFGRAPTFRGTEADNALLSNAAHCSRIFGPPTTSLDEMIGAVGAWVSGRGRSLGKPTHFQEREGAF